ncbi:imidazolonepropionase [bacterium SCSIO 12741]|nr:imidazolonepropionase [bacterium SCSIO 12741]
MGKILIKNIKQLVGFEESGKEKTRVVGSEMNQLNVLEDAWLAVEGDRILAFGEMKDWGGITDWNDLEVIDASGKIVMPAFCDSHSHIVYYGNRESEFADRIRGVSYEEIAKRGGGIINSALNLRKASEDELFEQSVARAHEVMSFGTGALEIKSGYGLSVDSELKMLRVIKRIQKETPLMVRSTLLAAHALPPEYKDNKSGYLDLIVNEIIPQVKEEGLAEYIDIFCEKGYFDNQDTERVLQAGLDHGLIPKYHVNQFTISGGIEVGLKLNALSVDHLEELADDEIEMLKDSPTISTLLPSCSFFLEIPYSPARKMIDSGLGVALATDYNPGSTPSGKMPFVMSLACIKMKMTPEEAINASCLNGAYAMGWSSELGSIAEGKRANLIITREMPSYSYIPYAFGGDHIDTVILNGQKV